MYVDSAPAPPASSTFSLVRPVALSMTGSFSFFVGGSCGPASSEPSGKPVVATATTVAVARLLLPRATLPTPTVPLPEEEVLILCLLCPRARVLAQSAARELHGCVLRLATCEAESARDL